MLPSVLKQLFKKEFYAANSLPGSVCAQHQAGSGDDEVRPGLQAGSGG